jgi:diguanylate cyclase (GGDEF)-like protein/PAS domain S-box-containing protein
LTPVQQFFDSSSYTFSAYAIPVLVFGVLNAILGIATLIRERASAVSVTFCGMALAVAVWLLSFAAVYSTNDSSVAMAWVQVEHVGLVFIPSTVYLFSAAVTGKLHWNSAMAWAGVLLSIALYVVVVATGSIVDHLRLYYWGYYPISGTLAPLLLAFFGVFLGASLHLYRVNYRLTQSAAQRRRLKAILIALGIACLATIDFLPTFGVPVYPFGYVFIGAFIAIGTRAIWQYRLVDITPALAARQIVDTMAEGLLVLDRDGVIRVANEAAAGMFGVTRKTLLGMSSAQLDSTCFDGALATLGDPDTASRHEVTYRHPGGTTGTAIIATSKLNDRTHQWVGVVCIIHDITERKIAEDTLREREALYRTLVETSPDAVILAEQGGRILMANGRTAELLGLSAAEELRGRNAMEFVAPGDRKRLAESFQADAGAVVIRDVEYTLKKTDGALLPVELSVSRVPDARGDFKAAMAVARDITKRKQAEEEIRYLAFHDVLTGAANRSVLVDRLAQALAQARRERSAVGLIFVDLDGFKQVNDSQGHDAGDTVLRQTAEELRQVLRDGDTLSRVGGDEFVVLLPRIRDRDETELVAKRILRRVSPAADGNGRCVSASLGIATYPVDGEDAETLLRHADAAMYQAKKRGGNDYQLFDASETASAESDGDAIAEPGQPPTDLSHDEPQRRAG